MVNRDSAAGNGRRGARGRARLWPFSRAHDTPAVALFRGTGLGTRPGRAEHRAIAAVGGLMLAGLAYAGVPDKRFALWFIGGAPLLLLSFQTAGWAVTTAARAAHRSTGRAPLEPRLRMALANLYRPGNATGDIVLSLGIGLTVLVAVAQVEGNLRRAIEEALPENAPSYVFLGVESDRIERLEEAVTEIDGTEYFRSVPLLGGRIVRVKGLDPKQAMVNDDHRWLIRRDRRLSYASVAPDNPVVDGQWWPQDYAGPPLLSVDVDVIDAFDLSLGDTITLNILGREITAEVRHVRRVEWQGRQINFALLLSPEPMRRAPRGGVRARPGALGEPHPMERRSAGKRKSRRRRGRDDWASKSTARRRAGAGRVECGGQRAGRDDTGVALRRSAARRHARGNGSRRRGHEAYRGRTRGARTRGRTELHAQAQRRRGARGNGEDRADRDLRSVHGGRGHGDLRGSGNGARAIRARHHRPRAAPSPEQQRRERVMGSTIERRTHCAHPLDADDPQGAWRVPCVRAVLDPKGDAVHTQPGWWPIMGP